MPFVHEIQIKSVGYPGAPGYTNLYFETTVGALREDQFTAAKAFLDGIAGVFPAAWSGKIDVTGRVLEANTGTLAELDAAPPSATANVVGAGGGGFGPGVAGLVIGWSTTTLNRGRLVRGRTFLVPLSSVAYQADGTIETATLTGIGGVADALIADNVGFCIWSRPRLGVGGMIAPVVTKHINDQAAFLSSRRS